MPVEPGTRLGFYEILGPLGAGGMGEVWRARDTRLQREVALKILPLAFASDADRLLRFTREAHVLASMNHPGIGAIYTFEEVGETRFLGLELVPGETLKQRIAKGPLPLAEALGIARQIADALEAAHDKGILHRDLKPANVKVTPEGRVKLLDFGLAKAFAPETAPPEISQSPTAAADGTRQGLILGTASYMSPEQARGRALDARSDLWSFGCLLFEMLAGRKAFDGESLSDILVAILDREPDWSALPKGTPPMIRDLLRGLLQKDVERRWRDVRDVKAALDGAFASRSTIQTLARLPSGRHRWRWAALAGTVAIALAVAFLLRTRTGDGALPREKYLAILPFKDLSGRPDGQLLADGLTESVGARLTKVPGLMVMATSTERGAPSGPDANLARFAQDRGANLVLRGAYRSVGDEVHLTYNLTSPGSVAILAADEVSGAASEQFKLEDLLTESVLAALRVQLSGHEAQPSRAGLESPASLEQYRKALGLLLRYDDPRSLESAVALLGSIPGGETSALVQSALSRALVETYRVAKDPAAAGAARRAADRAISLDDRLPEAHVALGQLLLLTGRPKDAVVEIRRALERQARSADGTLALADALARSGEAAEAEDTYRKAIDLNPGYWAGYNKLGAFYFQRGDLARALEAFRAAEARNASVPRVQSNVGAVLLRLGRFEEAEAAFRRALDLSPNPNSFSNLGTCQYLLGRFPEAASSFEKAVGLAPRDVRYRVYLGDAYAHAPGRAAEATTTYEKALELADAEKKVHPLDAGALTLVAKAEARTNRAELARKTAAEAVALEPENPNVLFRAAVVENVCGHGPEAVALLTRAVAHGFGTVPLEKDPELANLRENADYQKLLASPRSAR